MLWCKNKWDTPGLFEQVKFVSRPDLLNYSLLVEMEDADQTCHRFRSNLPQKQIKPVTEADQTCHRCRSNLPQM